MKKLKSTDVYKKTNLENICFETTIDVAQLEGDLIDQERAKKSLAFGLAIDRYGYNIFCEGENSTRKGKYLRRVLSEVAAKKPVPNDLCYIHNFKEEEKPLLLSLKAGEGSKLKELMDKFKDDLEEELSSVLNTSVYKMEEEKIVQQYQKTIEELREEYEKKCLALNYVLLEEEGGLIPVPAMNGVAVTDKEYDSLPETVLKKYEENRSSVELLMVELTHKSSVINEELNEELDKYENKVVLEKVNTLLKEVQEEFGDNEKIKYWLEGIKSDIVDNIEDLKPKVSNVGEGSALLQLFKGSEAEKDPCVNYGVNLIVDNSRLQHAPVVFVHDSYDEYSLFGTMKFNYSMNSLSSDYTQIVAGKMLEANGGYLVVYADELLKTPYAWERLKTILKKRKLKITSREYKDVLLSDALKPEEIPLDVKVIMLGETEYYWLLEENDIEFHELFGVHTVFGSRTNRNENTEEEYLKFIAKMCQEENLRPLTKDACCRVIEYASKISEQNDKLSLIFAPIYKLLVEADTWADIENSLFITEKIIDRAMKEKHEQLNFYEEYYLELLDRKYIDIDVSNEKVGQINGLAVMDLGDYQTGTPTKITANAYIGEDSVISIDQDAELTGQIYEKSIGVVKGFLGRRFAREIPLNICASICFEQSYGGIDGDSATVAQLVAVLSDIAQVPIKQSIAVTGSMNQKGEVQVIGGVNHKIEGFFRVCAKKGLTGEHGVVIPKGNIHDLMLSAEIREAMDNELFHIYAVETIEEALDILTTSKSEDIYKAVEAFAERAIEERTISIETELEKL